MGHSLGKISAVLICSAALISAEPAADAWSAPTACPEQFLGGEAPDAPPTASDNAQELCFLQFAVLHSSTTKTPLWSAEHLTRQRVETASGLKRRNAFHAEHRLQPEDRAELSDYFQSGLDRGHMAPSADMPDSESQKESFTLANIIPQNSNSNRGIWAQLEDAVRELARSDGDIFVVTGPIFGDQYPQRIHERVAVPTAIYKAVYDPARSGAGVYIVNNAPGRDWQIISIVELQNLTGLDIFPKLERQIKEHALPLPSPRKRRNE